MSKDFEKYSFKPSVVDAKPMTRNEYCDITGNKIPAGADPDAPGFMIVNANISECNVEGFDGFVSWLPLDAFGEVYNPLATPINVEINAKYSLSFSSALEWLKQGKRVARNGWNGKGMFLMMVKGESVTEQINDCYGDPNRYEVGQDGYEKGQSIPVLDAIYMKTADNKLVPWVASQTDMLSEDWTVV